MRCKPVEDLVLSSCAPVVKYLGNNAGRGNAGTEGRADGTKRWISKMEHRLLWRSAKICSYKDMLWAEILQVWEEESVAVCRLQDFISTQLLLRSFTFYNHISLVSQWHFCKDYRNCKIIGYNRAALCDPTGQTGPWIAALFSLPSLVCWSSTVFEWSSSLEDGLKPFCRSSWECSRVIKASMKETLSGSKLIFSASTSGKLQEKNEEWSSNANSTDAIKKKGLSCKIHMWTRNRTCSLHVFYQMNALRQLQVSASGMSGKNSKQIWHKK